MTTPSLQTPDSQDGFSLIEVLVSMALITVVMGATLGGLSDIMRGNDTVMMVSSTNNSLRSGVDLMVRDLLQVGSGLPPSHNVQIPSGAGATPVKLPGPPGSTFVTTNLVLPAVVPYPGQGHQVDGVPTDVLTVLTADNAFIGVGLTAITPTSVTIAAGPTLDTGPDRVVPGQLMMVTKGSVSTLVQVTSVDYTTRVLTFAPGDSLNLNQPGAATGSLATLNADPPANTPALTLITRLRMISYYLDTSHSVERPRLVRRVNNGHPTVFDNTKGTAIALDVADLQFRFDINNGAGNPSNVDMTTADLTTSGACSPLACDPTQVRKVEVVATARSMNKLPRADKFFKNSLRTQVALRGMAFVDRYQ